MAANALLSRLGVHKDGRKRGDLLAWLVKCPAHDDDRPSLSIAEKPDGRVVDFLLDHAVVVYPVNPKALDRARDRFRMSSAKSDPFDARVLAEFLRTDHAHLQPLQPSSEAAQELILTEFKVRQELGQNPDPAAWLDRFPRWRDDLRQLFEVYRGLEDLAPLVRKAGHQPEMQWLPTDGWSDGAAPRRAAARPRRSSRTSRDAAERDASPFPR